ncbi:PTS system mannitol-specific EIICBA component [Caloramator mitchellensis]|uniref:Mannitol-specific phosphotransferase enzyme IIA component n=1 Tax=Caloramator mitchellensis TaxID=908809 RepID=A0A0R3JYZ6_CALMK|nr:PTS mannitol transporter subunit IICBA [Caloramator mitchellensis]KRQ86462.1 PTS system mannitol-specific EIICBA component [Caloramator mitchellensis]
MNTGMQTNAAPQAGIKERVQTFGRFLSGMVMPNIGAFIAWGLITALFIPTGWTPNENLAKLVGPMIVYLLPLLIGYTGGKMVGGNRGGVLGAIATMGVVVGADVPMFLGAMIMGPIGGYVIKKFDESIEGKVPAGFEMLVNNFSAGIIGMVLALLAFLGIGPVVQALNGALKAGVEAIVKAGLLPLSSLFIEPGKILFLNNAINHGVLGPIGVEQSKELGKSIFFLLETNPGPGLGILLAYWVFSKGMVKESAPGAIIIHFLGGIHEIYFPYVLMNPVLILAVIAGGMSGVLTFVAFGAGLVATPSPGSIFALLAMTPKGGFLGVIAGVTVATVASFFIRRSKNLSNSEDLERAKDKMVELKGVKKTVVKKVVFACDAGMGSSAMGASTLRNKFKKAGLQIEVINTAIEDIPSDADIVVTHESLAARANGVAPRAEIIAITNFVNDPQYDALVERLSGNKGIEVVEEAKVEPKEEQGILLKKNIKVGLQSVDKVRAIEMAGELLVESGYVDVEYIDAMKEREEMVSTYVGFGVAIPHGVGAAKEKIKKSGIVVLQFPEGVDFGEEKAHLVIGIAGVGNEHLSILSNIASIFEDEELANKLTKTTDVELLYETFTKSQN